MDLCKDRSVQEIISAIEAGEGAVKIAGTWGSYARLLAAHISKRTNRPILYISPHIDDSDKTADDLHTFGSENIQVLPAWEGAEELADATDEIRAERLRIVSGMDDGSFIIPASIQAICQPVPKPESLRASCLRLEVDEETPPDEAVEWLVDNGFERVDKVDLPGQFASRGGIIDIFAPVLRDKVLVDGSEPSASGQAGEAVRVEFFGDTVESIRRINLDTQRSCEQMRSAAVVSAVCGDSEQEKELFVNILPDDCLVIFEQPSDIEEVAEVYLTRVEQAQRLYSWSDIYKACGRLQQVHISRFADEPEECIKVDVTSIQQFQHKAASVWAGHKQALEELVAKAKTGSEIMLYCESPAETKRVREIIEQSEKKVPANFKLIQGFVHQGFELRRLDTIVISHHELFGQFALRRKQRRAIAAVPVDTLADLRQGDYVVHASYGIGKFLGVKTIKDKGGTSEYMTIQYADGVAVQVSVSNITLIQKYIGTSVKRPNLSKIGSKKWAKQKEKVAKSVQSLAAELLEVQAKRKAMGGFAFGEDSAWQKEFEESFPYQETPDQITGSEEIKADMRDEVAMDRLLCGDVGYGKTEIAMRAAFKAVEAGKQVAVLVPTTVLCVQHGRTFNERFADFPVTIEVLNRFKTAKQAAQITEMARAGKVDILIGTHRLLSKDVGFKDLGLLIIDEEQRFGVTHKEKLKQLRVNVDVLTMTATPIPRTLHMSMLGLRDISSLGTPPLDRRAVVTSVAQYRDELIKKAILRELNRQGQVFFLHNRVKTINKKAWDIKKLLEGTGARIDIGHGQMTKRELEKAMINFVTGQTDVLVCTTIIESGLDIPNANTIIIDNADRFGLAELHQLRGRVGRYKHRAYAYMLLPASRSITPIAAKRLKAIEEYSHLGAGFRIALRDLEIRGAGNILGSEQSGHIQIVGYQMYCELLAEAVREMSGKGRKKARSANLDLGIESFIPKNYIPSDRQRMEVYRRIAVASGDDDLLQIQGELSDVYGKIPKEVETLLDLSKLRLAAGRKGIKAIVAGGSDLIFSFHGQAIKQADKLLAGVKGKTWTAEDNTLYLRLEKAYFEPTTLIALLRKILGSKA